MKTAILAFLLFLCFRCKGQAQLQIVPGHIDTVSSEWLKEKRPVWIYSPGYDTVYFTKPAYPVLYVLDGDGYFASLVTMVRELSVINGNTVVPEMIIVGIPNLPGTRSRDLNPSVIGSDQESAGGVAFTAFLEHELVPYIDKHYATAPYRMIVGHSLGGLTVMNLLLKHTSVFQAYAALDPSMFSGGGNLLTGQVLRQKRFSGKTLFLGIANTMEPNTDTLQVRSDTTSLTRHIRSILNLKDELDAQKGNGLRWTSRYYPDDDHASMPLIAEYDALRFVFYHNRFPRNQPENQYLDKSYSAAQLEDLIRSHYQLMTKEMGYPVRPPEALMNQFGYHFLQQHQEEKAFLFFKMNMSYYPESFNAYDSMGDYYLALGKRKQAIQHFKKALSVKNTEEIRNKLKKLTASSY